MGQLPGRGYGAGLTKVFDEVDLDIVVVPVLGQWHMVEQRAQHEWPSRRLSLCAGADDCRVLALSAVETHFQAAHVIADTVIIISAGDSGRGALGSWVRGAMGSSRWV